MILNIKLRGVFRDETVIIRVDEKEVYNKSNVTTDLSISFADSVDVTVDKSVVKVEVEVESGETIEKEVKVTETPFVDIIYSDGILELRESKDEVPLL